MPLEPSERDMILEIRQDVKAIQKLLLGNGVVGLCEQVRLTGHDVRALKFAGKWRQRWIVILMAGVALLMSWHLATGEFHNLPTIMRTWLSGLP